jgi:hypothetical protein
MKIRVQLGAKQVIPVVSEGENSYRLASAPQL